MKLKLVHFLFFCCMFVLFTACHSGAKYEVQKTVKEVIEFSGNSEVNENGMPLDSTVNYFPSAS